MVQLTLIWIVISHSEHKEALRRALITLEVTLFLSTPPIETNIFLISEIFLRAKLEFLNLEKTVSELMHTSGSIQYSRFFEPIAHNL